MNCIARYFGFALLLSLAFPTAAFASEPGSSDQRRERGRVLSSLPVEIESEGRYLFYLHGAIVEELGVRPVSPKFGVYEYEAILDSLAEGGMTVISEVRGPKTNVVAYAAGIAAQVDTLLAAGVPPAHVSIVGFSKGGAIAIVVSSLLGTDELSFVFLASCLEWIPGWQDLNPRGRILSVYEASDSLTSSCGDALRSMAKQFGVNPILS